MKYKKRKNKNHVATLRIFIVALFTIFSVWTLLGKNNHRAEAAPEATLGFDPASPTVSNGQSISIDLRIDPGSNQVTALELHIQFDRTKLQATDITVPSDLTALMTPEYNNSNGTATIIVGVRPGNPPQGITSPRSVASITFQSISAGSGTISYNTTDTQIAAIGEDGNVLQGTTSASVTIGRRYNNSDFANLVADWQETVSNSPADIDNNGQVNSKDLGIMMSNWE
jgi:hypothetical protein